MHNCWPGLAASHDPLVHCRNVTRWNLFFFFNCYLPVLWPTLGHSQGDSLINPMLITVFVQVQLKGHWEPCNKVGSLSPAECQAGFEQGTLWFWLQCLNPLGHSMVFSIGVTLADVQLNWLNWLHFIILKAGLLVILIDCMIFLSPFLYVTRISMSIVSFLAQLGCGILCLQNVFLWPMVYMVLSLQLTDIF